MLPIGTLYAGEDASTPDGLRVETDLEFLRPEVMPQDYVWRALGDHIAAGPSDVPQTVQVRVWVRDQWIGAQAELTYVELTREGIPVVKTLLEQDQEKGQVADALAQDLASVADGEAISWEVGAARLVEMGWRKIA